MLYVLRDTAIVRCLLSRVCAIGMLTSKVFGCMGMEQVNQILQEGKAVRARGGKSGFNVDEFVTKQRSRLHCHDMKELPETVAELRTTLVGPRGAHMTRNEKSSKQLRSNKKRAQSVQDVGSRKDVSGSLSARGRLVGITNSNLTLPPIQNRGMLTSRT